VNQNNIANAMLLVLSGQRATSQQQRYDREQRRDPSRDWAWSE
jgi:hypothetical protein